jgi:tripartite-type tricarboxylate transporter receptor subunit TctC
MMNRITVAVLAVLVAVGVRPLFAQNYPIRPIRLVLPSSPGGSSDFLGRLLAQKLSEQMGQQVVVDNRAGAGGTIGYDHVAKSAPDGYTLLIGPASIAINTSMYSKLPYSLRDFAPISLLVAAPNVLCVHPSVPAASIKALIALAKARPGSLTAGSAGIGTSPHLSTELFKSMAGIDMVIVHYKGSGPGMIALLSGETALAIPSLPTVMQYLKAGRVRALGVSTAKRTTMLPEVPTIAEAGLPGYEAANWFSLVAPAGTPQPIIDRLYQEIVRALRPREIRERIIAEGADMIVSTPDELASYMKSETEKWARVIKAAGIKPE